MLKHEGQLRAVGGLGSKWQAGHLTPGHDLDRMAATCVRGTSSSLTAAEYDAQQDDIDTESNRLKIALYIEATVDQVSRQPYTLMAALRDRSHTPYSGVQKHTDEVHCRWQKSGQPCPSSPSAE